MTRFYDVETNPPASTTTVIEFLPHLHIILFRGYSFTSYTLTRKVPNYHEPRNVEEEENWIFYSLNPFNHGPRTTWMEWMTHPFEMETSDKLIHIAGKQTLIAWEQAI